MRRSTIHQVACLQLGHQLEALGLAAAEVFARAGLEPIHIRGEVRAPFDLYVAAKGVAARLLGDPFLGFRLAAMTNIADLDAYGAALVHAPTIGDALTLGLGFLPVWSDGFRLVLSHGPSTFTLLHECASTGNPQADQIEAQQTMLFLANCFRQLGGQAAASQWISCMGPAPRDRRVLRAAATAERVWQFSADAWSLELPRAVLACPLWAAHPALTGVLRGHLERERETLGDPPDLRVRLRETIQRGLARGWTQKDVATALGLSVRSLQRQLHALNTDYSEQLHAVRMALAEALLRDTEISVEEVCHRVGFASLAGFSRFFAARSGVAPSQFRRGGPPLRTSGAGSTH